MENRPLVAIIATYQIVNMSSLINHLCFKNGKFILHRAISNLEDVYLEKMGCSWTADEKAAYCYGDKSFAASPYYYVYTALVPFEAVNWNETMYKAATFFPHEREVVLNEGFEVEVINVKKRIKTVETLVEDMNINFKCKV